MMKKYRYLSTAFLAAALLFNSSCKKYLDINTDPNNIIGSPENAPLPQILSSATVNVAFVAGSDLSRYTALLIQHFSGQSTGALNQTQQYEQYLISPTDANNVWSSMYASTLNDLDIIIAKANVAPASPHYAGVAEILKAYTFQNIVDVWGDVPYSQAGQTVNNLNPVYDDDAVIYRDLIRLIDKGIADVSATTSALSPGTNSTIYPGAFTTTRTNWIKFANTLKLRIYLHYSKVDPSFSTAQINALVASGAQFMTGNADSFLMNFFNVAGARNPIYQFETGSRANYLVANARLVNIMNAKADPRRTTYFTAISGNYIGAVGGAASNATIYSHISTYLTGVTGAGPIRMLTFAEYNFIMAEAVLRGATAPATAQTYYTAGITASLTDAGVTAPNIATYLAANGTLSGSSQQQIEQVITEKYVASYGQMVEPWTDYRRTGYPALSVPANALVPTLPRSLYYPQSEIDANTSARQKASLAVRTFWDVQ